MGNRKNKVSSPRWTPADPLHYLPPATRSLIDVGCNVGALIESAAAMGVPRLIGEDINPQAIDAARARLGHLPAVDLHAGSADALAAPTGSMDVACCCEVLEHVPLEMRPKVIAEIARVLKPGGTLIMTTPAAGLFAWMDPANMRFRLPRLFYLVSRPFGGGGRDRGYKGQKHGIVWHHHFSIRELKALIEPHLQIEVIRFRGALLSPIASWLLWPLYRAGKYASPPGRVLLAIERLDNRVNWGRWLAYNVLLIAKKPDRPAIERGVH